MKPVIVGTAGHIDHGKTALVKALTGTDADRLEEEKRRGITIDIGFANLDIPSHDGDTLRFGFVDVPGHERFVRNMLAGVGGIDMVLLVIAADESIKPQTREHFDITRLLGVKHGITVLTKCDLVDQDTMEVVRLEVEDFLRGSFLEQAPIIPVSSRTGIGIEDLKQALVQVAGEVTVKNVRAPFRLPVDRVFTMRGFGTVATGTLISGAVEKEQEIEAVPGERRLRVRGIQVHGTDASRAVAGQRTALNIAGATTDELARGMVLVKPDCFRATRELDVELTLLPSAKPLRNRARVHFHAQTAETIATVTLPGQDEHAVLRPGSQGFARILLEKAVLLVPEDRFIVRQFSPVITVGGGRVLDAAPLRKVRPNLRTAFLTTLVTADAEQVLSARIGRRGNRGLDLAAATVETGWLPERVAEVARKLIEAGKAVALGNVYVATGAFEEARACVVTAVAAFHKLNPLVPGIGKEELRERVALEPAVFSGILQSLTAMHKLETAGEIVCLPGQGVSMSVEEEAARRLIESTFASAALKAPALKEVLAGLKIDRNRAQKIVTLLLREHVLVKVSEDMVFHRDALSSLRQQVSAYKVKSTKLDITSFKELTGISRKYAIPLLEYLDREHITRRTGNERIIL